MKSIPDTEELDALRARIGDDPHKIAKLGTYVTLLSELDEDMDEGNDPERLIKLRSQIDAALRALDV